MLGAYRLCTREIRDRSRHAQHPVPGAHRHAETLDRVVQQIHGVFPAAAGLPELLPFEGSIALTETLEGDRACSAHPLAHDYAALPAGVTVAKHTLRRASDLDMQVDAVE